MSVPKGKLPLPQLAEKKARGEHIVARTQCEREIGARRERDRQRAHDRRVLGREAMRAIQ